MKHFVVIVYQGLFQDFDLAQEFTDEEEARAFARSRNQACALVVQGTVDDWYTQRLGMPLVVYCYGAEFHR
jgi:hypothetical protein